jgi:hypothetical protein
MNIFNIHKGIRDVGPNFGMPVCYVDGGLGVNYKPEEVLRKLIPLKLKRGDWIVLRRCAEERGVGSLVDGLKYIGMNVEVESTSLSVTPTWFTRADRWTVFWKGKGSFNVGALRAGQDMLVGQGQAFLDELGTNDIIDKGLIANGKIDLEFIFANRIRVYPKEVIHAE